MARITRSAPAESILLDAVGLLSSSYRCVAMSLTGPSGSPCKNRRVSCRSSSRLSLFLWYWVGAPAAMGGGGGLYPATPGRSGGILDRSLSWSSGGPWASMAPRNLPPASEAALTTGPPIVLPTLAARSATPSVMALEKSENVSPGRSMPSSDGGGCARWFLSTAAAGGPLVAVSSGRAIGDRFSYAPSG